MVRISPSVSSVALRLWQRRRACSQGTRRCAAGGRKSALQVHQLRKRGAAASARTAAIFRGRRPQRLHSCGGPTPRWENPHGKRGLRPAMISATDGENAGCEAVLVAARAWPQRPQPSQGCVVAVRRPSFSCWKSSAHPGQRTLLLQPGASCCARGDVAAVLRGDIWRATPERASAAPLSQRVVADLRQDFCAGAWWRGMHGV